MKGAAKANSLATGLPIIGGTPQVNQTLTADITGINDADGLTSPDFSYQWIRNDGNAVADEDIDGETGSTYTVDADDEGKTIKVRVTFADDGENEETLISEPTAAITAAEVDASLWSATMTAGVSGDYAGYSFFGQFGQLSSTQFSIDATAYTVWLVLHDADNLYFRLSEDAPENLVLQIGVRELAVGEATTVSTQTSTMYKWPRGDVRWSDGESVGVGLTKAEDDDSANSAQNTAPTGLPIISGTAQVGETLTVDVSGIDDVDGMDGAVFGYQWVRNDGNADGDIDGETASTYTVGSEDEGKTIKAQVNFTDDAENEESLTSAATAAVAAAPTPLTASFLNYPTSHDGPNAFTFELRFSEEVALSYVTLRDHALTVTGGGVTGASRLEQGSNQRWNIRVQPDGAGDVGVVLAQTTDCDAQGAVCTDDGKMLSEGVSLTVPGLAPQQQNSEATGAPTISGTLRVGETLTASTVGIADADGLVKVSYSYQWMRGDGNGHTDIAGQIGRTYELSDGDVGKTIKVRISFTDDAENEESVTSAATGAVAPRPPLTARLESQPSSHDGLADFTFELHFSEEFGISYLTLRDHAFTVTGGTVNSAQRLTQGSNVGWRITVTPDSDDAVTVVLPVTTDCDATGAVCTADYRKLSNRNVLTVSGPNG